MSQPLPPREVRIPSALGWGLALSALAGLAYGAWAPGPLPFRVARAVMHGAGALYLAVSLVDFAEHFRLEKEASGRWLAWTAVPVGETVNHVLTVLVLLSFLVLARPLRPPLAARDWWALVAPAAFLALGWRDELVYHRRRCAHREDIMHTTAHLAAGTMLTAFAVTRFVDWSQGR